MPAQDAAQGISVPNVHKLALCSWFKGVKVELGEYLGEILLAIMPMSAPIF